LKQACFPWTSRDAYELIVEETNYFKPFENFNIVLGGNLGFYDRWEGDARTKMLI
jgi:hypothetical protein